MSDQVLYPIAEEFRSIQGEGCYTGTPMKFIRLAGCSVGVFESKKKVLEVLKQPADLRIIYPHEGEIAKHSVCTSVFGEQFICDTNYRATEKKTASDLLNCREEHVCLTGGEPFIHDLTEFFEMAFERKKMLHIETSGTYDMRAALLDRPPSTFWVTCSPKKRFVRANIPLVNEWKFVVGSDFNPSWIEEFFSYEGGRAAWSHPVRPVFLQPIQPINYPDLKAITRVLSILNDHPGWRLSAQLHKFLELR